MEEEYIKSSDGIYLKKKNIRWVLPLKYKNQDCFAVCTKPGGCSPSIKILIDKWLVCKNNAPESYKYIQDDINKYK